MAASIPWPRLYELTKRYLRASPEDRAKVEPVLQATVDEITEALKPYICNVGQA